MIDVKTEKDLLHKRFVEEMEARSWEEIWRIADKAALVYPVKPEEKPQDRAFRYRQGRRFGWGR